MQLWCIFTNTNRSHMFRRAWAVTNFLSSSFHSYINKVMEPWNWRSFLHLCVSHPWNCKLVKIHHNCTTYFLTHESEMAWCWMNSCEYIRQSHLFFWLEFMSSGYLLILLKISAAIYFFGKLWYIMYLIILIAKSTYYS